MQINLTITVKGITAESHAEAKELAWYVLQVDSQMRHNLRAVGSGKRFAFMVNARTAREVDGTYTVTIP